MRRKRFVAGLVVLLLGGFGIAPAPAQGLFIGSGVNKGCIGMRITYSTCGIIPYPCAHISFWQPKWIATTKPGMTNQGGQHYHFHHAVVRPVDFLFNFTDPCTGCTVPTPAAMVPAFYETLTDPAWRVAQAPLMPPPIWALRVGLWGGYYPRVGFVTHPSPVVASGLAATRAFDIARQPIDLWPVPGLIRPTIPLVPTAQRVVLPCMCRRFTPIPPGCFRAGLDAGTLSFSPASPTGIYEWVIWQQKRCTLPLPLSWCAQALDALPNLNFCL
jgi:hypothetical protein